jgi:hypothetical protein
MVGMVVTMPCPNLSRYSSVVFPAADSPSYDVQMSQLEAREQVRAHHRHPYILRSTSEL